MSLTTPLSVHKLQTALHDKAKGSPKFRFYALYDKVYREDVMAFAYECCKANRRAAGVGAGDSRLGNWPETGFEEMWQKRASTKPRFSQQDLNEACASNYNLGRMHVSRRNSP
jgi:hypothetical protein